MTERKQVILINITELDKEKKRLLTIYLDRMNCDWYMPNVRDSLFKDEYVLVR